MPQSAPLIDNIQQQVEQNQSATSNGPAKELTPEQVEMGDFASTILRILKILGANYFKTTEWIMNNPNWCCFRML